MPRVYTSIPFIHLFIAQIYIAPLPRLLLRIAPDNSTTEIAILRKA